MERRSVSELYAKYLLCKLPEAPHLVLQDTMYRLGLIPPETRTFDFLRSTLKFPKGFVVSLHHHPSAVFLKKEQIFGLFYPDKYDRRALKLLDQPQARIALESWFLTGATPTDVARFLRSYAGMVIHEEAIRRYVKYMFNYSVLAPQHERIEMIEKYHQRFGSDYKNDARWWAATTSSSSLARRVVRERLGVYTPSSDEVALINQALYSTLLHLAVLPTCPNFSADKLLKMTTAASMLHELKANSESPSEDIIKARQRISLKQSEASNVMLHTLSGGNHNTEIVSGTNSGYNSVPLDVEYEMVEEKPE